MEEIDYRTPIFDYERLNAARRDYAVWLLGVCATEGMRGSEMVDEALLLHLSGNNPVAILIQKDALGISGLFCHLVPLPQLGLAFFPM